MSPPAPAQEIAVLDALLPTLRRNWLKADATTRQRWMDAIDTILDERLRLSRLHNTTE